MTHMKILGLTVVAVAAMMAIVGGSTASATVLCKNNLNTSTCSEKYAAGTVLSTSVKAGTSITLETTGGTVLDKCSGSTLTSKIENAGSATTTASGKTSELTWSGCTVETKTIVNGSGETHWISGTDNGTLTTSSTEVTVNTGFFGACVYGPGNGKDMGAVTGGAPAGLAISAIITLTKNESGLCPSETRLTGEYTVTSPSPLWFASS
jgi:hypothetical protein